VSGVHSGGVIIKLGPLGHPDIVMWQVEPVGVTGDIVGVAMGPSFLFLLLSFFLRHRSFVLFSELPSFPPCPARLPPLRAGVGVGVGPETAGVGAGVSPFWGLRRRVRAGAGIGISPGTAGVGVEVGVGVGAGVCPGTAGVGVGDRSGVDPSHTPQVLRQLQLSELVMLHGFTTSAQRLPSSDHFCGGVSSQNVRLDVHVRL